MPAFEVSAGGALASAQALTRHLAGTAGYSTTTRPTLAEVQQFRDQGYYKIAAKLAAYGYTPSQSDTEVLGFLEQLQVLEIVIPIELSHPISGNGEPNERFQEFANQRDALYELIDSDALSGLGATKTQELGTLVAATGISVAERDAVRQDTDFPGNRFRDSMHDYPGTSLRRGGATLSADTLG